ncbi:MAG TPA: hypothetical protein VJZ76_10840 [Thermoanaerobaculia bacterium]|nr:hypothetical protein [Thermoanaerobaculia bacterium]
MERFLDAVDDDPKLRALKIDVGLWSLYADVLQEELGPYAFRLAYETFSKDPALIQKRAMRAERDSRLAEQEPERR